MNDRKGGKSFGPSTSGTANWAFACFSAIQTAMKRSCSPCTGSESRGGSWFGGRSRLAVNGRGSFAGNRSGMLELLFDNQDALIRSKQVFMRLGTKDEVDGEEKQEEEMGHAEDGNDVKGDGKSDSNNSNDNSNSNNNNTYNNSDNNNNNNNGENEKEVSMETKNE